MPIYSDDQVRSYLAGTLPDGEVAELEAQLETSPELERRLLAFEPFAAQARAAFAGIPADERLVGLVPGPSTPARWNVGIALAACLAGIVGFGLGIFSKPTPELGWRERIAIYQSLYVPATVAPLDPMEEELDRQFVNGSKALEREIRPQELQGLAQLRLVRAQILETNGLPIMQIVFSSTSGEPLAFCIVNLGDDVQPAGLEFEQRAGVPTAHWVEGEYGYMLVGRVNSDVMNATAQELRARFQALSSKGA